jgi:hypothetical protein
MGYTVYLFARLSAAVYRDVQQAVDEWRPFRRFGVPAAGGFFAELYGRREEKRWVLAIRGSDDGSDWFDNANILLGDVTSQIAPAQAALRWTQNQIDKQTLCLTGHSLGGGLASLLAVDSGLHAVTFDAPGMARSYGASFSRLPIVGPLLSVAAPAAAFTDRIINIRASFDLVSLGTGPRFGRVETIDVAGCEPFTGPFGVQPAPHLRSAAHDYGHPDLARQSWRAVSSAATYPLCQHGIELMERELRNRPEYNRDLGW